MNRADRERLMKEVLTGDEVAALRQTSLRLGLRALTARKKRRSAMRACLGCSAAVLLGVGLFWQSIQRFSGQRISPIDVQRLSASAPAPAKMGEVKVISDDELLALFPGRSVALIGKPGHQQLRFIETNEKASELE